VAPEEMVGKIRAAVDARRDPDFTIMARTDALSVNGIEDAIERMQRYVEAGADMAFIEAPESVEQMRRIVAGIGVPSMANMVPGGRSPLLTAKELEELGFAVVAHPTALTYAMAKTARDVLRYLRRHGSTAGIEADMLQFEEFNEAIGLGAVREAERRYGA